MNDLKFWAGSPESLHAYIEAVERIQDKRADYMDSTAPEQTQPRLLGVQVGVGVISIKGALTNTDSWMNQFIGATSYGEIRDALIAAAENPDVKSIALDISSGGGSVAGMSDTADLISTIDKKVKPVFAFSDSIIASAAYNLGVSARSLEIGKMAEAGSIGIIMTQKEVTKMMEKEGITATVIRSGKYKALGGPYEVLSDTAKEVLQAQVDQLDKMFVEHVAQARGTTTDVVSSRYGQGRMFIGQSAVDVGLVDGITSFDAFMSKIQSQGIDKRENSMHISQNNFNKGKTLKHALTDQEIAAMASGAAASVQATATDPAPVTAPTPEPVTAPVAATPTPEPTAPVTASLEVQVADTAVVALLQSQLAAAQAQVVALSVDLQTLKANAETQQNQSNAMRPIVRAAVSNLRIALGGTAAGVEAMTDDLLMAEHANLATQFQAKFKSGGVTVASAVSSSASKESQVVELDPLRQARLAATRIGK